ncbi:MAG: hypothetical protein IEMM0008_0762 [bacterium]|nr:MAG: hypothetical protein IEMM0008_0762 [bacterium]
MSLSSGLWIKSNSNYKQQANKVIYKYLMVFLVMLSITCLYDCSSLEKGCHRHSPSQKESGKYYNRSNLQDLLYIRDKWVYRIKKGDLKALKVITKADFYTLANRLDCEPLNDVPISSPAFKVFAEPELTAIIIGMLENKEESIRETCAGFLKRFLDRSDISATTKRKIKKSFREARIRKEFRDIDIPRGTRPYFELTDIDKSD